MNRPAWIAKPKFLILAVVLVVVVVVEVASTSVVSLWFSELVTISALETPPKIKTGRPTASIRNLGFAVHAGRFIR